MEKIENQQLKEEIKDFAVNQLNRCKTFTDVFGKKFARTCLNRNVNKVYTNIESRNNIGGFYKASDYSINLCISGENGQKCTIEQILKNEENKAIVFHELVHALLRKDYKNFNCGTGILERYRNGEEVGRGLNEGLTNWIVKMCQIKPFGYPTLTKLANELELAIGPKRLMKMCKGNVKNTSKNLRMSYQETLKFLAITDEIYSLQNAISFNIQKIEDMKNGKNIADIFDINIYNKFLNEQKLQDTSETRILYLKNLNNSYNEQIKKDIIQYEDTIIDKYISKKCEKLFNAKKIKKQEIENLCNLYKLLDKSNPNVTVISNVIDKYYKKTIKEVESKIESKKFTIYDFMNYKNLIEILDVTGQDATYNFFYKVSSSLLPKNPNAVLYLMQKLDENNNLKELSNFSIIEIETREGKRYLYNGNDNKSFSKGSSELEISASQEIDNPSELFGFTQRLGDDFNKTIKQFLYLKESINQRNPNAQIKIIDRGIVVSDNGNTSYYYIEGDEIVPAKFEKELNIKEELKRYSKRIKDKGQIINNNLPVVKGESLYQKIKKAFIKNDERRLEDEKVEDIDKKDNTFRRELSDMSNYSQVTISNINLENNDKELGKTEEEREI